MFKSIYNTKNLKRHIRGTIFHTGCENQTADIYEVQADRWYQDWFSVEFIPVLKWTS